MAGFEAAPAAIAALAPNLATMANGLKEAGPAVNGIVQAAETACSTAVLADALFLFRSRWQISLVSLGGAVATTGGFLTNASESYASTDQGVGRGLGTG